MVETFSFLLVLIIVALAALCFIQSTSNRRVGARVKRLEDIAVIQGEATLQHLEALKSTRDVICILESRLIVAEKDSRAALMWAHVQVEEEKLAEKEKEKRRINGS